MNSRTNYLRRSFQENLNDGRKSDFENQSVSQGASLLKYEVRKWVDPQKQSVRVSVNNRPESSESIRVAFNSARNKFGNENKGRRMPSTECTYCIEFKEKIKELEQKLENEQNASNHQLDQLENQLELSRSQKEDVSKNIKKLQKEIKKIENNLDEEQLQTRRLGIKLEDANYEIGRLRQELINSQLENEKIVEENEDLAVDNEDLLKERDEIIQIYDELFRESERLKHEVKIWKSVFENSNAKIPSNIIADEVEEEEEEASSDEEEVSTFLYQYKWD